MKKLGKREIKKRLKELSQHKGADMAEAICQLWEDTGRDMPVQMVRATLDLVRQAEWIDTETIDGEPLHVLLASRIRGNKWLAMDVAEKWHVILR